MIVKTR